MAKISKQQANYRTGAKMRKCKTCRYYSGGYCSIVSGKIASNGTSDYWKSK